MTYLPEILEGDGSRTYRMNDAAVDADDGAWIIVGNVALRIRKQENGVLVEAFPNGPATEPPLESISVPFSLAHENGGTEGDWI